MKNSEIDTVEKQRVAALAIRYDCSRQTVYRAIRQQGDSYLLRQIRLAYGEEKEIGGNCE